MLILRLFGPSVAHVFVSEHDASARCNTDKKLGGDRAEKSDSKASNVDKQCWDDFERFQDLILLLCGLPQVETSTIMRFGRVMMEQVNTMTVKA